MKSSRPVQMQIQSNMRERHVKATKIAGGMYAIMKDSVRLFTPAPASQEMKEWKIPLPVACPANYCFHPGADVIAFVERQEPRYVHSNKAETASSSRPNSCSRIGIHLRTLSDGKNHPAALSPTIHYSKTGATVDPTPFVSITSSRLAVLVTLRFARFLVVWDWKSGSALFVCPSLCFKLQVNERG